MTQIEEPLFKVFMSSEAKIKVGEVLDSGYITQGKQVDLFEKELGEFLGNDLVLTVNSCTSGLTLAFHLLKEYCKFDTETDIVLTTPLTCTATNWPILHNGMKLRWVDVDPETCLMDLSDLESKLNEHTKIICIMHWGGYPYNFSMLKYILDQHERRYNFRPIIVQDAAHAFGTDGIGSPSSEGITVFSFQAIKLLTTGDGGAITFDKKLSNLYQRAKLLRWFGLDRTRRVKGADHRLEDDVQEAGWKYHMNDLNAAIGRANLKCIPKLLNQTRENAKAYDECLSKFDFNKVKPLQMESRGSSFWLYSIWVADKERFMEFMKNQGIQVSQVHDRNDKHSCVSQFKELLPNLDKLEKGLVCIPVGWWVNKEFIIERLITFFS